MAKKEKSHDEIKEAKRNEHHASKVKENNKLKKQGEKAILDLAAAATVGQSSLILTSTRALQKEDAVIKAANARKRAIRASLKGGKVKMRSFDAAYKMLTWAPEDIISHEIHVALYKEEMGLKLTDEQKKSNADLQAKRQQTKKAMLEATGGDTGTEIGSGTGVPERADLSPSNVEAARTGTAH